MPATNNLTETFKYLIADFNDAHNVGNYNKITPYLYPSDLLMQKADDPGQFVWGKTAADIMNYLNTQIGQFPQFNLSDDPYRVELQAKSGHPVGVVSGKAKYQDHYTVEKEIDINYIFYFRNDTSYNWLLWTALVIPTTLLANS